MSYPANDNEEEIVWLCDCGSAHFYVTPSGFLCTQCNSIQRFEVMEK
jgi:RNase P subunit RPR2